MGAMPPPEEPSFADRIGGWRGATATGVRAISGLLSNAGFATGAGIAGGGEALAQGIETLGTEKGLDIDFDRVGVEAALGAVPFGKVLKVGKPLASGALGALFGGTGAALRLRAADQPMDSNTIALHALLGGGLTAAGSKFLSPAASAAPKALGAADDIIKQADGTDLRLRPSVTSEPAGAAGVSDPFAEWLNKQTPSPTASGSTPRVPFTSNGPDVPYRADGIRAVEREEQLSKEAISRQAIDAFKREADEMPPVITERLSAPSAGGTESMTRVWRMPEQTDEAVEAVGAAPRSQQQLAALAKSLGLDVQIVDDVADGAVKAVDDIPQTPPTASFLGYQEGADGGTFPLFNVKGGASDGSTVGVEELQRLGIPAPEQLPSLEQWMGTRGPKPSAAQPPMAASTVPMDALRRSPVDVSGDHYQQLKAMLAAEGGKAAPEGLKVGTRTAGRALQNQAKAVGLPTGKAAQQPPTAVPQPVGPMTMKQVPTLTPAQEMAPMGAPATGEGFADFVQRSRGMSMQDFNKLPQAERAAVQHAFRGTTPPPAPKPVTGARPGGAVWNNLSGERGFADPEFIATVGLGGAGGLIGAGTDPLGDPLMSGLAGVAVGASLPTLATKVVENLPRLLTGDPIADDSLQAATDPKGVLSRFMKQVPNYLRANMLAGPNLVNNALGGPWGAGMSAATEMRLAGDPRGVQLMKLMNPENWFKEYQLSLDEARLLIKDANLEQAIKAGVREPSDVAPPGIISLPAVLMMAGDLTTRRLMQMVGMPEELARRYTMTAEPATGLGKSVVNFQRGGPLQQLLLPFARTLTNIAEQSAVRTPIVGPMIQKAVPELAYPEAIQRQQQALGALVPSAAGALGYMAPDDDSNPLGRFLRSAVSNVSGPYSGLAAVGYAAGGALRDGDGLGDVARDMFTEGSRTLPMPTFDVPTSWASPLFNLLNGEAPTRMPAGAVPTFARELANEVIAPNDLPKPMRRPLRPRRIE